MRRVGLAATFARIGSAIPAALILALTGCGGADSARDTTAAGGAATAQASSADADLRDVSQYELTMEKMDKYVAAMRNMALAAKDLTPDQRERLKASGGADANTASLDDYAAQLEREPVSRDAIRRAGLSTREFAVASMAYLQAGMADAVLQMRSDIKNADSIAREMKANPANVRFVRDNRAALDAKFKALAAEMKAAGMDQ